MKPNIKIFISAHKNVETIKGDCFEPLQVGAAMRGRARLKNFLHDDDGENISDKNERFCELTAQYWAWKNYKADYYGFFHYRRYIAFSASHRNEVGVWGTIEESNIDEDFVNKYKFKQAHIEKLIPDYDIILPDKKDITLMPNMGKNMREQYLGSGFLHEKDLDIMLDVLREKYPAYMPDAEEYLSGKMTYLNNMFIMRKEVFDHYNKWLFDILFECDKRINYEDYSIEALRTPGHLAERLLNIYIAHLRRSKDVKIGEFPTVYIANTEPEPSLLPAFAKNNIAIALSADNFYAPYLATVINSIKKNASDENNYDLIVMHKNISLQNQKRLLAIVDEKDNFSLRFLDISRYQRLFSEMFLRGHFTIETWFRLLLPKILTHYDKILYLDSDLAVNSDLAEVYRTDIKDYLLAACRDADTAGLYNGFEPQKKLYMDEVLKIKKPFDYFQAGVILFNLEKFRNEVETQKLLEFASSYDWELLDQDVLNYFAQGKIKYLDMAWNVMFNWRHMRIEKIISRAPKYLYDEYMQAREGAKIVHYAGPDKPWQDPSVDFAALFWHYAKDSGFYEEIIYRNTKYNGVGIRGRIKAAAARSLPAESRRGILARKIINKLR